MKKIIEQIKELFYKTPIKKGHSFEISSEDHHMWFIMSCDGGNWKP